MNQPNIHEDRKQGRRAARLRLFLACIVATSALVSGCSHGSPAGSTFKEANDLFGEGSYQASLNRYEGIIKEYPGAADRALFEMGIIYAYPSNGHKDYGKSLECFQKILRDYPESKYRRDSAEMISHINNVTMGEKKILAQQARLAALEQELSNRESENVTLQKKIAALEQELSNRGSENAAQREEIEWLERELRSRPFGARKGVVSRIIIEKGARRLTLMSNDKALKSYKIALGGNPNGPKERQGDNKTPEGNYKIDSRNRDSQYHLSLHISYPNENDVRRAKKLGVSPGGNIMIHGLKNGFSWVGDAHTEIDWTRGCIAVTDEEIEEIASLVPNGTVVEIRP